MKNNKMFIVIVLVVAVLGYVLFKKSFQSQQIEKTAAIAAADLVKDHSPYLGPVDAPVQIVEFLDPECESCRALEPYVKALMREYEGKVRLIIRYMPFHGNSLLAAVALEEAREQGKYWEALSALFLYQPAWGDHHNPRPELIPKYLIDVGVSAESLADMDKLVAKHSWKVDLDFADGKKLGVRATPTFFVNGKMLFDIGYQPIKNAIEEELKNITP